MEVNGRNLSENWLQNVTIEGRKKIFVSGVQEVSRFEEDEVVLETVMGELCLKGGEFRMERFSLDTGEVAMAGFITSLEYESDEPSSGGGFLSRIFG